METQPSVISVIKAQLERDMRSGLRSGGGWFHAVFFFAVFACFMAFTIGPERAQLSIVAPGLLWLGAMLSMQLSGADLFSSDYLDDTLKVIKAEHSSLAPYLIAKLLFLTLTSAGPIAILAPFFFIVFGLQPSQALPAAFIFLTGVPILILSAAVSAAISTAMRSSNLLGASLAVPVAIPALIFGVGATKDVLETAIIWSPEYKVLLALGLIYIVIIPPFLLAALRFGLE